MILDILTLPDGSELSCGATAAVSIRSLSYTAQVNAARELDFGSACAASVQVQLLDTTGVFSLPEGTRLIHYRTDGQRRVKMGTFFVSHPTRKSPHCLSFTAYDAMLGADVDLTAWLAELPDWPYTMEALLLQVCEKCGLELGEYDLPNGEYPVLRFARQVTGRQLIGWIAGANARYAAIDPDGLLTLTPLRENPTPLTDIKQQKLEDFTTAALEGVALRQAEGDLGVVYPAQAGERYTITGNPMLAALSAADLEVPAGNLAAELTGVCYTPGTVSLFCHSPEIPWKAGQLVAVGDAKLAVFTLTVKGELVTLGSAGQPSRSSADARYSRDKTALLQGQMTQLHLDMDGLQAKVSRVEALEVGARNRIRASADLCDEAYYFESGAALTPSATVTGQVLRITDASAGTPVQVTAAPDTQVWLWGANLLENELAGTYTPAGALERGEFRPVTGFREGSRYTLSIAYSAKGIEHSSGGNLLYLAVQYTDGLVSYATGITAENYTTGRLELTTRADATVKRIALVSHARWTGGSITVQWAQLILGASAGAYAPYVPAQQAVTDESGQASFTAIAPEMTIAAMTPQALTVTYRRPGALEQVVEDWPFPRFTVRTLPECFVLPDLMEPGKVYTLSFLGRGGEMEISGHPLTLGETWQRHKLTFPAEQTDLRLRFLALGTYDLYQLQLEQGSLATDYRPAPEDSRLQQEKTQEQIAQLQVGADRIGTQLTQLQTTTQTAMDLTAVEVQQLKQQLELTMTARQVELTVKNALSQGAEKVVTGAGYTFDDRGLTIRSLRSEMENFIDHTGMQVRRAGQPILRADAQGVTARDVQVENYLVVGDHARLEDYSTPTDPHRTACFWL